MVVIRMARGGRTKQPFFTIVAADSRRARDGKFLQKLGRYNPASEHGKTLLAVDADAISAWVSKGAVLSDTVRTLLRNNKIELPKP